MNQTNFNHQLQQLDLRAQKLYQKALQSQKSYQQHNAAFCSFLSRKESISNELQQFLTSIIEQIFESNKIFKDLIIIYAFDQICDAIILDILNQHQNSNTTRDLIISQIKDEILFLRRMFETRFVSKDCHRYGVLSLTYQLSYQITVDLKDATCIGHIKDYKMYGFGQLYYNINNKMCIVGTYENGLQNGFGIHYHDRFEFRGMIEHNHRTGSGRLQFVNGDVFEGNFKNDLISGGGVFYHTNGNTFYGVWKERQLYQYDDTKHCDGSGVIVYQNGDVYGGEWSHCTRNGRGKLIQKGGEVEEGIWKENVLVERRESKKCNGM